MTFTKPNFKETESEPQNIDNFLDGYFQKQRVEMTDRYNKYKEFLNKAIEEANTSSTHTSTVEIFDINGWGLDEFVTMVNKDPIFQFTRNECYTEMGKLGYNVTIKVFSQGSFNLLEFKCNNY